MLVHLLEVWRHVVSVLADTSLQTVVLFYQAGKLAFSVLSQALLLFEQIAELLVLGLEDLVVAAHLGHHDSIGCIRGLVVALFWKGCGLATLLLGLLQDVQLPLCHSKLHRHATRSLLALHDGHVVLELVVGGGQPHIAQGIGEVVDHGSKLFGGSIVDLFLWIEDGGSLDQGQGLVRELRSGRRRGELRRWRRGRADWSKTCAWDLRRRRRCYGAGRRLGLGRVRSRVFGGWQRHGFHAG